MAQVTLPPTFQKWTNGTARLKISASNISELVMGLEKEYPDLKNKIISDTHGLLRFVKIFLNGDDIGALDGVKTKISDKDKVKIILALAGG